MRPTVRTSSLLLVAVSFVAGVLVGFSYHHIIDEHHEETAHAVLSHAPRPGPSETQWQRFEARLAALEQQKKRLGEMAAASAAEPLPKPAKRMPTAAAAAATHHHASTADSSVGADGCPNGRKPYHLLLTAQDSVYQAWQTRVMYYHFKKLQRSNPCSEMTGFTRMLNSDGAKRDGLMDEMPTVLVHALDHGSGCRDSGENTCDMGFPVMNRPHGVTQLLAKLQAGVPELAHLTEQYVLIAETDHVFIREPKNMATPKKPACFPFGYMNAKAKELRPIVQRFVDDPSVVDPCGPSPVIIHLPLLRKLTPEWLDLSFALKRDPEADKVFGWVLEMWGYTLAATRLGIRHHVWNSLQAEPSALWHSDLDGDPHIYHYTFGLEYTADGMPVTGGVGDWSLDKRHFMSQYPPPNLDPPPKCAGKAAHTLHRLFNEAITGTPSWPANHAAKGTLGWGAAAQGGFSLDEDMYRRQPAVQRLVTQGPWTLAGASPVLFFRMGRLSTPWGSGTWGFAHGSGGKRGHVTMTIGSCGTWRVALDASGVAFTATHEQDGRTAQGELAASGAASAFREGKASHIIASTAAEGGDGPGGEMVRRLLGSGPWAWTGVSPVGWLRGGVLHTPWGPGTWKPHASNDGTIIASFVGEHHHVTFAECASFVSLRERDNDRATGAISLSPAATSCPELSA